MRSLIQSDVINAKDTIVQIARCSFDVHVQDVIGTLTTGATLVMLHPGGIFDFEYLADVMKQKNITWITTVPTMLQNFFTFLELTNNLKAIRCLRSICSAGMRPLHEASYSVLFSTVSR